MRLIHRIRCYIDEPYRIRTGFGLSPIRNKRELIALIKLCDTMVNYEEFSYIKKYNKNKYNVLVKTLELFYSGKHREFASYVINHAAYYWN